MGNALFCYPDRLLGSATYPSVLSGGAWRSSFPLVNLKDRLLSKVTRSTNALTTSTNWDTDLGTPRNLRLFALLNSNLSPAATVRRRIYTDSGYTQLVHDTGALPVPWAALDAETLTGWRPDFWHALAADQTGRYVRTEVVDPANPAGYVEIGRALMMSAWQPQLNIAMSPTIQYDHSDTTIDRIPGGPSYATRRSPRRVENIALSGLAPTEAHQAVLEMQRILGRDGELFFVYDPTETDFYARQKSFLCTMREATPLEYPYYDRYTVGLTLEEVL